MLFNIKKVKALTILSTHCCFSVSKRKDCVTLFSTHCCFSILKRKDCHHFVHTILLFNIKKERLCHLFVHTLLLCNIKKSKTHLFVVFRRSNRRRPWLKHCNQLPMQFFRCLPCLITILGFNFTRLKKKSL